MTRNIKLVIILLIVFIIVVFGIILLRNNLSSLGITNNPAAISYPSSSKIYSYTNNGVSFQYPDLTVLSERSKDISIISYQDATMVINFKQMGIGMEDPAPEVTEQTINVNGHNFVKERLFYKDSGKVSYLINISYPDQRNYSIIITYDSPSSLSNDQINMFDSIVQSIRFQ